MDPKRSPLIVAAYMAATAGCSNPVATSTGTVPITMQGVVSPAIVGSWRYISGTYTFGKDGTYDVHYDYMSPAGPGRPDTHAVGDDIGSWSADDRYIYLKSVRGNVIRDRYELSSDGSKIDLYAKYARHPEVLRRKKR